MDLPQLQSFTREQRIALAELSDRVRHAADRVQISDGTFPGLIPPLLERNFANDAAAATGGVPVGQLYHTAGVVKIRLT